MYYCLNFMIKWCFVESKEIWGVDIVDGYIFRFIFVDCCKLWIGFILIYKCSGIFYIFSIYFLMFNKFLNVIKDMFVNKKKIS